MGVTCPLLIESILYICVSKPDYEFTAAISKSDMMLRGQIECGTQYHFTMETQTALVVPQEGETYLVYSSTQWVAYVQAAIANVLGVANSRYETTCRLRLGPGPLPFSFEYLE